MIRAFGIWIFGLLASMFIGGLIGIRRCPALLDAAVRGRRATPLPHCAGDFKLPARNRTASASDALSVSRSSMKLACRGGSRTTPRSERFRVSHSILATALAGVLLQVRAWAAHRVTARWAASSNEPKVAAQCGH